MAQMDEPPVRPFTASSYHRSKLVTADGFVGNYVCAILENRGTGREVGIASIERETGMSNHRTNRATSLSSLSDDFILLRVSQ